MQAIIGFLTNWFLQLLIVSTPLHAQIEESYKLSDKLNEISGLEFLNDSTLIALNDGGNKSEIYLLNLKGEILRNIDIKDIKNRDWEDIARDDDYLYIGDIGNNLNKRDNLVVIKVKLSDIIAKDEVDGEKIKISYAEQTTFPPKDDSLFFDAEAMTIVDDSIWIFTKDRSEPFQGISHIYKFPTTPGEYTVSASHKLKIGSGGWWTDGLTAADYYNGRLYLLTYNRYIEYDYSDASLSKKGEYEFKSITQRESVVVLDEETIFVADEHNPIAGEVRMYRIRPYHD